MNGKSFREDLDSVGLPWLTVLLVALASSLIYMGPSLWQTWTHEGPSLVTSTGFVSGHDFVAFYSASKAILAGDAARVYDRDFMMSIQSQVVGASDIGYLAFMYPPTYLLLVAPLAMLPYFPALALWQILPLALFLLLLRRIALPPLALIMAAGAPAVAQTLFAGQNGLVFAVLLGGGLIVLDRRPLLAGLLLGLGMAKPQLAALLIPALLAGRQWKALGAMLASTGILAVATVMLFGPDVWFGFAGVPAEAREYLALGQLPWSRMPTVYTAARLAGSSDPAAATLQAIGAVLAVAGVAWLWWRGAPAGLRIAGVVAGMPLVTPFLYDYDLPVMLFAVGLYLADALKRGPARWEKVLLLLVWLQPVWWWWQIVEVTAISPSPLIYAAFLAAILIRARTAAGSAQKAAIKQKRADAPRHRPSLERARLARIALRSATAQLGPLDALAR